MTIYAVIIQEGLEPSEIMCYFVNNKKAEEYMQDLIVKKYNKFADYSIEEIDVVE